MNKNCCTHYKTDKYLNGYIISPIFKISYCCNCGEISAEWGVFANILWHMVGKWIWDGTAYIESEDGNE
jgi:hypothetical protein